MHWVEIFASYNLPRFPLDHRAYVLIVKLTNKQTHINKYTHKHTPSTNRIHSYDWKWIMCWLLFVCKIIATPQKNEKKKRKENQIKWKETNAFKEWTFVRTIQGFRSYMNWIFTQTNQPIDWPTNRQTDNNQTYMCIHMIDLQKTIEFSFIDSTRCDAIISRSFRLVCFVVICLHFVWSMANTQCVYN